MKIKINIYILTRPTFRPDLAERLRPKPAAARSVGKLRAFHALRSILMGIITGFLPLKALYSAEFELSVNVCDRSSDRVEVILGHDDRATNGRLDAPRRDRRPR